MEETHDIGLSADAVDLERLGFAGRFARLFEPLGVSGLVAGRVSRIDRGMPLVLTAAGQMRAEPASHLVRTSEESGSRAAVGDWVALATPEGHEFAIIEAILPRSSAFSRRDPSERGGEQVVAANVDIVFVMQSLTRELNLRRLERELVLAWDSGARPVVVLSKSDLALCDVQETLALAVAASPGVDVHAVSSVTGEGIDALLGYFTDDRTIALLGSSGVGKSTLVNRLTGVDVQRVADVRESDQKGRHTTVARELFVLPGGGVIVDTPGMRGLALWDAEDGIAAAFTDVERLAEQCRFRDCAHVDEPGCAVVAAVDSGELQARRLRSYHDLKAELEVAETRRQQQGWKARETRPAQRKTKRQDRSG